MNKKKRMVQAVLALGVIAIGIYMWWSHAWGTPPSISGIAFIMIGLALWTPYCPVMKMIFGGAEKPSEPSA